MKLIKYLFGLAILIGVAVYWLNNTGVSTTETTQLQHQFSASSSVAYEAHSPAMAQAQNIDVTEYQQCNEHLNKLNAKRSDWTRKNHKSWGDYVGQDFTLNEVTLAVEHFLGENFANAFKSEYIQQNSEQAQKEIQEALGILSQFSELVGSQIRYETVEPDPLLEGFSGFTPDKKRSVLAQDVVTVEDVAHFLRQPDFPNSDLILLIDALPDLNRITSYYRSHATAIIDYAIQANRPEIVSYLIKMGARPTADDYLSTSMDWALKTLRFAANESERKNAITIVRMLVAEGVKARFNVLSRQLISGGLGQESYQFDANSIDQLEREYDLDLMDIETTPRLKIDTNNKFIEHIDDQLSAHYVAQYGEQARPEIRQACKQTIVNALDQWQPKSPKAIISQVTNDLAGDEEAILAELAKIDPDVLDRYQFDILLAAQNEAVNRQVHNGSQFGNVYERIDQAYDLFRDNKPDDAIELVLSQPIPETSKQYVMLKLMSYGNAYLDNILNSALRVEPMSYGSLKRFRLDNIDVIKQIMESGFDLDQPDESGKSLVYYAAMDYKIDVVNYLNQQRFSFHFSDQGSDPLHQVLTLNRRKSVPDKFLETISALMAFDPIIDKFHLSRMKLLSIYFRDTYEQIVALHPQLMITQETELPKAALYDLWSPHR